MSKSAEFNIIVHYPVTEKGKKELAKRVARVHSEAVIKKLASLNCQKSEKEELLKSVIASAKQNNTVI